MTKEATRVIKTIWPPNYSEFCNCYQLNKATRADLSFPKSRQIDPPKPIHISTRRFWLAKNSNERRTANEVKIEKANTATKITPDDD